MVVHCVTCRRLLTAERTSIVLGRPVAYAASAALSGALSAVLAWRLGLSIALVVAGWLAVIGPALAAVDVLERRLPNILTLGSIAVVLAVLGVAAVVDGSGAALLHAGVGALTVGGFLLVVSLLSGGGLGAGDVKLGALVGLIAGWNSVRLAILCALAGLCIAAVMGLISVAIGDASRKTPIPLGPALVAGAVVVIACLRR